MDPVMQLRSGPKKPQLWNRYTYVAGNPLAYTDPAGEEIVAIGDSEAALQAVQEMAREAGASDAAALLETTTVNGEVQITSGGVDLSTSNNSTVQAIGQAIKTGRTELDITSAVTEDLLRNHGAMTTNPEKRSSQTTRITMNPDLVTRFLAVGQIVGGPLNGRSMILGFTAGEALAHEFGHSNEGIARGIGAGYGKTDAAALRQEYLHRGLRGTPVLRSRHDYDR